jgi:hypothetical protein
MQDNKTNSTPIPSSRRIWLAKLVPGIVTGLILGFAMAIFSHWH